MQGSGSTSGADSNRVPTATQPPISPVAAGRPAGYAAAVGFADRIAECNAHDLRRYVPFSIGETRVGWVRQDRLAILAECGRDLHTSPGGVQLDPGLTTVDARSAALGETVDRLMQRGEIRAWRGERYPIGTRWGAPALAHIERAAVPWFGAHAYGVHVNGFVRTAGGLEMWIARRSRDKPTYPGLLDNLAAGGQPIGLSLHDNVVKECGEEAAVPAALARGAKPVSAVTYVHENDTGLKPDCMFCFDLELPDDFVPRPADGEAESFHRWPLDRVAALVRDGRQFKFNCNLVIIDFLLRHGAIAADAPEFLPLVRGLRAW